MEQTDCGQMIILSYIMKLIYCRVQPTFIMFLIKYVLMDGILMETKMWKYQKKKMKIKQRYRVYRKEERLNLLTEQKEQYQKQEDIMQKQKFQEYMKTERLLPIRLQ